MTSQTIGLVYAERKIGEWIVPTVEFKDALCEPLRVPVKCTIINSTGHGEEQKKWKFRVASEVYAKRGTQPWCDRDKYAISLAMCFHPGNHRNQKFDMDNFVKPIIDAIAAGLFCTDSTELQNIKRWCYDDSNFNTLLIHRLPDAQHSCDEGIAISVSVAK